MLSLATTSAQELEGPIVGFSVDEADRATGRRRWLLRADRAVPDSDGRYELSGTRLELYDTEVRGTNLILMTPRCRFDPRSRAVSSPGPLQVNSGEGGFTVSGEGFGYAPASSPLTNQATGILTISNQVHATVRKALVNAPGERSAVAGPLLLATSDEVVQIHSRRLTLQPELAVFREDVRVEDSEGELTCELLTARFTEKDWQMRSLAAEQNVRMESGEIRAEAGRATYETVAALMELTGSPSWRMGPREGRADEVRVDRRRRHIKAAGNVAVTLPAEAFAADGGWLPEDRSEHRVVERELKPIQVLADEGEFQPEASRTNVTLGVFRGNVRIRNDRGRLTCGRLTAATVGREHQVQTLVAEEDVIVEQGENRVTCARAEYAAAAGTVELTGRPVWRLGEREGESDRLWLDSRNKAYRASGQVKMRLPASEMGSSVWLLPRADAPEGPGSATERPAAGRPRKPVEIACDDFEFRAAAVAEPLDRAVYQGHVQVTNGERMRLTCEVLSANVVPGSNQVQTVLAERAVVVRVTSAAGGREARGDTARFVAATSKVELSATNEVEILVSDARGSTRATGRRATYDGARDTFELDGRPLIVAEYGVLRGDRVQVDQTHTTLIAHGAWSLRLPLKTLGLPEEGIERLADPFSKQRR